MTQAYALIQKYYAMFNAGDVDGFLDLLTADVTHDINQGGCEVGVHAFRIFLERMNVSYREHIKDIVIMVNEDGTRCSAEFMVHGEYIKTDEGLPQAKGQKYILPAGAFFEIKNGKVSRISNYYNLEDWISQVSQ